MEEQDDLTPRILVIGVGGAGGNAVNNMIESDLQGVEFVVANTDAQALQSTRTVARIQLGLETSGGQGAGMRPELGAAAAEESLEEIKTHLQGANMVFVAAGMGGGTGTGAAPVIARAAREAGILTVGVVTKPFDFEGRRRMKVAEAGVGELSEQVDTLIVVPNQNLFRMANDTTRVTEAFRLADDVLYSGVRGITDLIVLPGLINLDFADVRSIMSGMGNAMMGMAEAEGENRALDAAKRAIKNPLLDDVTMRGAKGVLINITGGYDMTLFELDAAANEVRREVDEDAEIIVGSTFDPDMEGRVRVSVVAAGVQRADAAEQGAAPAGASAIVTSRPSAAPAEARPSLSGRSMPADAVAPEMAAPEGPAVEPPPAPAPMAANAPASEESSHEKQPQIRPGSRHGAEPEAEPQAEAAPRQRPGFHNLFAWKGDAGDEEGARRRGTPVSDPDVTPEAARFDDAELEIPAFLRRVGNH